MVVVCFLPRQMVISGDMEKCTSTQCRLLTGVPQGSMLGPFLLSLLLYFLSLLCSWHLFSLSVYPQILIMDPYHAHYSIPSSHLPSHPSCWMAGHPLKLNPSKTGLLSIAVDTSPGKDLIILRILLISWLICACFLYTRRRIQHFSPQRPLWCFSSNSLPSGRSFPAHHHTLVADSECRMLVFILLH